MKKAAWYRLYTSVLDPFDKTRALSDRLVQFGAKFVVRFRSSREPDNGK